MNEKEAVRDVVCYWLEKASESLAAASDEMEAGRITFSVNRIYYACFYVVSALLLQEGCKFKKHSGVRSTFHQQFVKTSLVSHEHGLLYDELFEARQRADYMEFAPMEKSQAEDWLRRARDFVARIRTLIQFECP